MTVILVSTAVYFVGLCLGLVWSGRGEDSQEQGMRLFGAVFWPLCLVILPLVLIGGFFFGLGERNR